MVIVASGAVIACGGSPTSPSPADRTFLTFTSQLGDPIGGGLTYKAELKDGTWDATVDVEGNRFLWVHFTAPPGSQKPWWTLNLAAPSGQALTAGTYEGAQWWGLPVTGPPKFSFGWDGKTCSDVNGRFVIDEFKPGARGTLDRLLASFEMRCGNALGQLTGRISIVANPWR